MSWNYRVLKHEEVGADVYYGIHEVYYDSDGKPARYSAKPMIAEESILDLRVALDRMSDAIGKEVLTYRDFKPKRSVAKEP